MTPEERAAAALKLVGETTMAPEVIPIQSYFNQRVARAIREAENDAYEKAAAACDEIPLECSSPYELPNGLDAVRAAAEAILALKHPTD
jgi:hypothetical protein